MAGIDLPEVPLQAWARLDDTALLESAARHAGRVALQFFEGENKVWYKPGNSPVSLADKTVDNCLRDAFSKLRPDYGWLSEESEDGTERHDCERIVIVDPIDGTRGFLDGSREWCVAIAVIENDRPVDAAIYCPPQNIFISASRGKGTLSNGEPCKVTPSAPPPIRVTATKKLNEQIADKLGPETAIHPYIPSLAWRLVQVATGSLDAAFARSGAYEWDIAAADLILEEAGGKLTCVDGRPMSYNKVNIRAPSLVAAGRDNHDRVLGLAKRSGILQ